MASGTILVPGGTGLVGSHAVRRWRTEGRKVVTVSSSGGGDMTADFTDLDAVRDAMARVGPSDVINFAALANVDRCEREPDLAHALNCDLARNIGIALPRGARFVHISTDMVYASAGMSHETDVDLLNIYARSKYAGDLAARDHGATVLRLNVFGRSTNPDRSSFSDWVIDAARNGRSISLYDDVLISPLSFGTIADLIMRVVADPRPGIFNFGSAGGASKAAIGLGLVQMLGLSADGISRTRLGAQESLPVKRPLDMRMDCGMFGETFGIRLPTTLEEMEKVAGEYQHHGA